MNREAIAEIVWVVKQSEWRFLPTRKLRVDSETAARRVSQTTHSILPVMLIAAGGYRQDLFYGSFRINQQEHLPIEIYFDVAITRVSGLRRLGAHDGLKVIAAKLAGYLETFPLLKSYQCCSGCVVDDSVGAARGGNHF